MVGDPIDGAVQIAKELKGIGVRLLALSNWSAETFPRARAQLGFLDDFEAVLLSGRVGLLKPDPAIYRLLMERHDVHPAHTLFIDDSARNVESAARLGFDAIVFRSAESLREELTRRDLLSPID
jgi:2-haloacid dehalogenase